MCNTNNSSSLKERVQYYISKEDEIKKDYQNRMNALNDEATADILANCPIKVGDVYVTETNNAWGVKRNYYKVAKLEANVNGSVDVYGCKRKLDKTWGKRDNMFMFIVSAYDNFVVKHYEKVEDYVEPSKD